MTDFSAFRDFGFIAASGMVLCWVVKTLMVPPLLLLLERRRPDRHRASERAPRADPPATAWATGASSRGSCPRPPILFAAGRAGRGGSGPSPRIRYVRTRSDGVRPRDRRTTTGTHNAELHHAWAASRDPRRRATAGWSSSPTRRGRAARSRRSSRRDWDAAPASAKPFAAVHSLWDMVPDGQQAKVPVLSRSASKLERARDTRGFITDADWERVKDCDRPRRTCSVYGIDDLPETIAAPLPREGRHARAPGRHRARSPPRTTTCAT